MARVAVEGGVAVGPASAQIEGAGRAGFTPDQSAGWALYFALGAVVFILLVAYSSTRG
jgi:hypothetical protein